MAANPQHGLRGSGGKNPTLKKKELISELTVEDLIERVKPSREDQTPARLGATDTVLSSLQVFILPSLPPLSLPPPPLNFGSHVHSNTVGHSQSLPISLSFPSHKLSTLEVPASFFPHFFFNANNASLTSTPDTWH